MVSYSLENSSSGATGISGTWFFSATSCLCGKCLILELSARSRGREINFCEDMEILIWCLSTVKIGIFNPVAEIFIQKTREWLWLHSLQECQGSFWSMERGGSPLERLPALGQAVVPEPSFPAEGEWWPLLRPGSVSVLRQGPTWVQIPLCTPCARSRGAEDTPQHGALVSSGGRDWFSCSTFLSVRGERVKYLFTHSFAFSWAELKPAFLPCASFRVRFTASLFESPAFLRGLPRQNWCKLFLLRCLTIICHPMQARRQLPQQTQRHD